MKIGIDARSIGTKVCGVSRVALCQINGLAEIDAENDYIVYTDDVESLPGLPANFRVVRTGCNRMNLLHDFRFYRFLKRDGLDLLHVMHAWLPLAVPGRVKKVVTIYDIFSVTDPQFFIKRRPFHPIFRAYFRLVTWLTVARADAVLTISRFCVDEIRRTFRVHDKRIEVVYLSPGITPAAVPSGTPRLVERDYLFYLGNFRSYKNVPTLVRGYALFLQKTGSDVDLVIAGNDDNSRILALARELGIERRLSFYYRPDDEVVDNLYRHARAFVFPSLCEGFGIPPIEAMSFGVPVVISDAAALVETSGSAALVFDRNNPADLAEKLSIVVNDAEVRADLVARGHACATRYTWTNGVRQLKAVYESLVISR